MSERLEERRKKYEIPDAPYEPVFDRCLVYQIPTIESETFGGGLIVKADVTKKKERTSSPRGVLVAAGMRAREILESHGIHLGDIVWFARMSLWKHELDASSKEFSIIRAAEITGSEDLSAAIKAGAVKFARTNEGGFVIDEGATLTRIDPQEFDDA